MVKENALTENQYTLAEEDYIKVIYHICQQQQEALTNDIAERLATKPASVSDMLKKLAEKKVIHYIKYRGVTLTDLGMKIALNLVRKHRLWETFLYEKLSFTWDEVHEVAEQLEHIQSVKLLDKIDEMLDFPEFDPHGEIIPNRKGEFKIHFKKTLEEINVGEHCKMVSVNDNTTNFLQYVVKVGLGINNIIKVVSKQSFDNTMEIEVDGHVSNVSQRFAKNIYVVCKNCESPKTCSSKHFENVSL